MVGRRRALVAVLAAAFAVLGMSSPPSTGVEAPASAPAGPTPAAAAQSSAGKTELASVSDAGAQAPSGARDSILSGNGRWDVFASNDDLAGASNGGVSTIYARNLVDGHTVQLSGGSNGSPPASGQGIQPSISDDGRYVSYLLVRPTLTVATAGSGAGGVTSSPVAINCGASCTSQFDIGTPVTLTATPTGTSVFGGWTGDACSGSTNTTCDTVVNADMTVTATFNPPGGGIGFAAPRVAGPRAAGPAAAAFAGPRYAGPHANSVTALAAVAAGTEIVVCDRDPDGDGVFDEASPADNCATAHSAASTGTGSILPTDRPRLAPDGSRLVWTQFETNSRHSVRVVDVSDANGLLTTPQTPITVTGIDPNADNTQPSFGAADVIVMVSQTPDPPFKNTIVQTRFTFTPQRVTQVDVDLDGNDFLSDHTFDTTCGGDACTLGVTLDHPSMSENNATVVFHYGGEDLGPAAGRMILVRNAAFFDQASEVVSVDSAGAVMTSDSGALSGDGRYVAFDTADPDPDLFTPSTVPNSHQVIDRDVITNTNALVTPSTTPCTPLRCGSTAGRVSAISIDSTGGRVGYESTARDLVPGDTTRGGDAFVRTWQPSLSNSVVDLGAVQAGTSTVVNLQATVTGFGGVSWDAVRLGGTDAADFTLIGSTCRVQDRFSSAMHDGETCVVSLRFSPSTPGPKTATVSLTSTQFASPQPLATLTATATATGQVSAAADNTRTSVRSDGSQSPTGGHDSMISGNGRWQVFVSDSALTGRSPLVVPSFPDENVFVRDLADPQKTVQISLHSAVPANPAARSRPIAVPGHPRGASPDGSSFQPSISSDGRFVSFFTDASDIVPLPNLNLGDRPDYALVVCDRDPSGKRDAAGNPILDLPRPGTRVPNYACFLVQAGAFATDSQGASTSSTPRLSGDGTRIAWVEDIDTTAERVRVATLSRPGRRLQAPRLVRYVATTGVPGFPAGVQRLQGDSRQLDPTLTEDGNAVVYRSSSCTVECNREAIIETDLRTGVSTRFDTTDGGASYLGDVAPARFDAPATSDAGDRVAFAFQGRNDGFSRVYVATRSGNAIDTVLASLDNTGNPSAGTQPALSGDGRYLAFQTSLPNESNGIDPPGGSCFVNDTNAGVNCQVVARDLVKDAARASAALPPLQSEIVSSSISTNCPNPLPAGRKCGGDDESSNPSVDETGSEIGFDSTADDIVPGDDNVINCEGSCPAPDAFVHTWRPTIQGPAFDFGPVLLGAKKVSTFTVTESGFGPISLGSTAITGQNAAEFKLRATTCTGATLNDGQQCKFKIRFTPAAQGNRVATLATAVGKNGFPRHNPDNTLSYDPAIIETLTGVGTQSVLVANPNTLDFGTHLAEDIPGVTKTVTITNGGTEPVTITGAAVQDTTHPGASGDYTVNAGGCVGVLPAGGSCAITVRFLGHAVGRRDAVLVISNDSTVGPVSVGLLAKVRTPQISVNPGVTPPGRVTVVSGTGFAPKRDVVITLRHSGETITARADKHGAFDVGLVIFRSTVLGPRTVQAHTAGTSRTISARTPLLIALGSVDLLDLVTRH